MEDLAASNDTLNKRGLMRQTFQAAHRSSLLRQVLAAARSHLRRQPWQRFTVPTLAVGCLLSASLLPIAQPVRGAGVTIITHGFENQAGLPPWMDGMGDSLSKQIPGYPDVTRIWLTVFKNGLTGDLTLSTVRGVPQPTHTGEVVVEIDWSDLAGLFDLSDDRDTVTVAAFLEPYLRASLWSPGGTPLPELPIHFIGHSRGASLVCELARRFGQNGIWVDHVTTLDPHPVCYLTWVDAPVTNYSNVLFADNYWQDYGSSKCDAIVDAGTPCGFPVSGATNRFLTTLASSGCSGLNYQHSNVHLWYHGTIDLGTPSTDGDCTITSAERSSWWAPSESQGANTGFKFSRIKGGTMDGGTRPNDGLRTAGAARVPVTLTATNDDIWPNIEIVDFTGDKTISQLGTFQVNTFFEDVPRTATVEIGVDSDANPYNGGTNAIATIGTSFLSGNYKEYVFDNSIQNIPAGTHYVYAKISNSKHTRYYYAKGQLIVTPSVPTLASGTVTPLSGSTSDSYTYHVQYIDPSGNAPLEKKVYVDSYPYDMALSAGAAANGTYSFTKSSLDASPHNYRFAFKSASGSSVAFPTSGTLPGPTVSSSSGGGNILVYVDSFGESVRGKGGTVAPAYHAKFAAGDQLWFTAFPDFGWQVDYWQMFQIPQTPQTPDYVAPDKLQAKMIVRDTGADNDMVCYFKRVDPNKRILTLTSTGPGTTTPQTGKYLYDLNVSVPLSAAPAANATFTEWSQDGVRLGTNTTYNLTMDADKSIRAVFAYNATVTYTNDLPCIQNATIYPNRPQNNMTHDLYVYYQPTDSANEQQVLLKCDISQIPSNSPINEMDLHIVLNGGASGHFEIQKNTGDWSETNVTSVNPTCENYDWGGTGGGFAGGVDDYEYVINLFSKIPPSSDWISDWWKNGNFGLRLRWLRSDIGIRGDPNGFGFYTRHSGHPPFLRVIYQGPRPIPEISTTPTNMVIQVIRGETGTNAILNIWNSGEGTLSYAVSASTNWMVLSGATTGTSSNETRQVTVAFDVTNLPLGSYSGTLSVVDTNASNNPVTVPVTIGVLGPQICVGQPNVVASCLQGDNPTATTMDIYNCGHGTLKFSLSNSASWFTLGTTSGISSGQVVQAALQYNAGSLPAGNYNDTIIVADLGGDTPPVNIPVSLTVYEQVATPGLSPISGTYTDSVAVAVSCATAGATIHYTTDGVPPSELSTAYGASPIILSNTTLLRARAWKAGMLPSAEQPGTYAIIVPPTAAFVANPTNGTPPLAVTFVDTSTGTVTNRFWSFGDRSSTNLVAAVVQHTYDAVGTNTVQLTVSGPAGESTITKTNYIVVTNNPPDTTPPALAITSHVNGQTVVTNMITVAGTASDAGRGDNGISSVTLNGQAASGGSAPGSAIASWSRAVSLNSGTNSITVIAKDNSPAQNSVTNSITVTYSSPPTDATPPTVAITSPTNNQAFATSPVPVSGTASDNVAVALVEVRVNGTGWQTAGGTTNWSSSVSLTNGANLIEARSRDTAGNTSSVAGVSVTFGTPLRYTLNLVPSNGGTVTANPPAGGDGKYAGGTSVDLTPNPGRGAKFDHWSGDAPPVPVVMNGNKSVTAHFVADPAMKESPLGTWEVAIKGADKGLALVTFVDDFTLNGYGMRAGEYGLCELSGSWGYGAKAGVVLGECTETVDSNVTWNANFSAKVKAHAKLSAKLTGAGKQFTWTGKPAATPSNLSGQWTADVKKACPTTGEVYIIAPYEVDGVTYPAVFALTGDADGALLVGSKGNVYGYLARPNCGESAVTGKFSETKLTLKLKGITETGLKFSISAVQP